MKNLLIIVLMLIPAFYLNAQSDRPVYADDVDRDTTGTALRTTWMSNKPGDNWFITVQGGIVDLMSEESRYVGFTDRVKPTFGLSFGKWMSPVWGVRLNFTGAKMQGFATWTNNLGLGDWYTGKNYTNPNSSNNQTNNYVHAFDANGARMIEKRFLNMDDPISTKEGNGYSYDLQYAGASLDFMLNLKNFFMKYNENAFFNPILYGGIGYAHTFKDGDRTAVNSIMERFGLMFDFRLSDAWSVNLDAQYMLLPEVFDRRVGDGNTQDALSNYMLGFTYRFNDRHFHKAQLRNPAEIAALNDQINELKKRPVSCPPVVICPPCPECPKCPEIKAVDTLKTPITKQNLKFLPTPVFFKINSSVVQDDQWRSIQKAAEFLLDNPNERIKVTGYADKQTGNPTINKRLSEARAKSVYDILVKKYGISPSRIETSYLGDTFQPFAENDWNRVVIFVIP